VEAWVGAAIVAAFISGLVSLIVVQLNFRQGRRIEQLRREEKIRDFQIALRAEIRSGLVNLSRFNLDAVLADVESRYAAEDNFSVIVPRLAKPTLVDAIVSEIHILPEGVIGPVVLYIRQRRVVETMAEDMRDGSFRALAESRQLAMYRDYLGMWNVWREMAADAEKALDLQLSSSAQARSGR
jgi:hypothetical protein